MENHRLITIEDIREAYPSLPDFVNPSDLDPCIDRAQDIEIQELLGPEVYLDMMNNITDTKYVDLINGKDYEWVAGRLINYPGLKPVVVHYAYARYIGNRNVRDTESGLVVKKTDQSDPADPKEIARLIGEARSMAMTYQDRVKKYIVFHIADFPFYFPWNAEKQSSGFSIRAAGGEKRTEPYCPDEQYKYPERF